MKLLADENFPFTSVLYLREQNFDILAVGGDFQGISDKSVLDLAMADRRTLLTFDRDFGELILNQGYKPTMGVVLFRLATFLPDQPGRIIHQIIQEGNIYLESAIIVVDDSGIRQRKF